MIWIRGVFWVSAVYDFVIGLAFLVFGNALFEKFEVVPPNHPGYYQFPAFLLLIFAALFVRIALDPIRDHSLMLYGVALKATYAGVVFHHHLREGVPGMWLPFAYADLGFLALFLAAYVRCGSIYRRQANGA